MAEKTNPEATIEVAKNVKVEAAAGSAGLDTHLGGQATTVSGVAEGSGGVKDGNYIEPDIDEELYQFKSGDTPLMDIMLKARKVQVKSSEVWHAMVDEDRPTVTVASELNIVGQDTETGVLHLLPKDKRLIRPWDTIVARTISGYEEDGATPTPGKPLMLLVQSIDASGDPVVRASNGVKTSPEIEFSCLVTIPEGTVFTVLGNALYETQKRVQPSSMVPVKRMVYLQKRGMNHVVSDYFDSQKKGVPSFTDALAAEKEIRDFKKKGNRTLWAGVKGKFKVNTELGPQYVYTTEGIRYQFMRELMHKGNWTFEQFVALAKMYYTGVDVPQTALVLCGKNFLENIQCIDFSKHPEIKVSVEMNKLGWKVTQVHTVFGDFQFKREPTLDDLGFSNSAAIIGEDRVVHYQRVAEHSFSEDVEGEEAKRTGVLVFDTLALKGACHIWIDGEKATGSSDAVPYVMHDSAEAPASPVSGTVYYLMRDCAAINKNALQGQMWRYDGSKYVPFEGDIFAKPAA